MIIVPGDGKREKITRENGLAPAGDLLYSGGTGNDDRIVPAESVAVVSARVFNLTVRPILFYCFRP